MMGNREEPGVTPRVATAIFARAASLLATSAEHDETTLRICNHAASPTLD